MAQDLIPSEKSHIAVKAETELVAAPPMDQLLAQIRPEWQAKSLIQRVKFLLPVDPSSACQRLLNAAIHDLRKKIVMAGLDLAADAAKANRLPPVTKSEDVFDDYSTSNILALAYRIGIISRPEWHKLKRAYDIRRDLEHEDDEYQAGIEDCIYVFKTCIDSVLSREPIELLKVHDVKEFVESPDPVTLSKDFLEDYEKVPEPRQLEISCFLAEIARDKGKPDLVRQNAVEALRGLNSLTRDTVKIELANQVHQRLRRNALDILEMKIAAAMGYIPYLKQRKVVTFFEGLSRKFEHVLYNWRQWPRHSGLFDELDDCGGLLAVPPKLRQWFVTWMALCYLGEPGGYGWRGHSRQVFNSDTAAPRIRRIFEGAGPSLRKELEEAAKDDRVKAAVKDKHIARRWERLFDFTEPVD